MYRHREHICHSKRYGDRLLIDCLTRTSSIYICSANNCTYATNGNEFYWNGTCEGYFISDGKYFQPSSSLGYASFGIITDKKTGVRILGVLTM